MVSFLFVRVHDVVSILCVKVKDVVIFICQNKDESFFTGYKCCTCATTQEMFVKH